LLVLGLLTLGLGAVLLVSLGNFRTTAGPSLGYYPPSLPVAGQYQLDCSQPVDNMCPNLAGSLPDIQKEDTWLYTPTANLPVAFWAGVEAAPNNWPCDSHVYVTKSPDDQLVASFAFGAPLAQSETAPVNLTAGVAYMITVASDCVNMSYLVTIHQNPGQG